MHHHTYLYVGVDIGKSILVVHLLNRSFSYPNTPRGHAAILRRCQRTGQTIHFICEATGGYQHAFVAAAQAQACAVTSLNPRQARDFARARGLRAKTDRIDAAMLTAFGQTFTPSPDQPQDPAQIELAALAARRQSLAVQLAQEKTRLAAPSPACVQLFILPIIRAIEEQLALLEAELHARIANAPATRAKLNRLRQVEGVGLVTALTLLAQLPELGSLTRKQAAALAGLAPLARDSGAHQGQRHIGGGRAPVRRALYMAALTASRCNPTLKAFYQQLCQRGKKPKVALTAVMRKLLVLLNHILKYPNFSLAN